MGFEKKSKRGIANPLLIGVIGIIIVAVVISAGVMYEGNTNNEKVPDLETGTEVGMKAPGFSLTDLEGGNISLENLRGNVVILDFMATWCPPCKAEMSHLKEISQKYDDSDLSIVSIDVDSSETEGDLKDFAQEHNADWRFGINSDAGVKYKVSGIPTLYILDKKGIIRYKSVGVVSASELASKIEPIL